MYICPPVKQMKTTYFSAKFENKTSCHLHVVHLVELNYISSVTVSVTGIGLHGSSSLSFVQVSTS